MEAVAPVGVTVATLVLALRFAIPDGWREEVTPHERTAAEIVDGREVAGMAVAVVPTRTVASNWSVLTSQLRTGLQLRARGTPVEDGPRGTVDVGAQAVRWVSFHAGDAAAVVYVVPGGARTGLVTFTCPRAELARYQPLFEATIKQTTGVAMAEPEERTNLEPFAIGGGVLAFLLVMYLWIKRRSTG